MALSTEQRLHRLCVRTDDLLHWQIRASLPIAEWTCNGAPLALGEPWPAAEPPFTFSASAEVPADWPLDEAHLLLDLGGESLIAVACDGGAPVHYGLDPYHRDFRLTGRHITITAESTPRLPFGEPVRGPRLNDARLIWQQPDLEPFILLLMQIAEAIGALADHEVVPHLLDAAETALRSLTWPSSTEDYISRTQFSGQQQKIWQLPELKANPAPLDEAARHSLVAAHKTLTETLRSLQTRFPPQGELVLTGHAHIDLAWLWPYGETRRKVRRTFHTALSLMESSPDFRFNQSTAAYYHQLETDDPALLGAIKGRVAHGVWETIGGMWVEPDTNMPTGESLVRQILYGQRYFERTFGVRHSVCWLPDCFGFSPALPQLLKLGGIANFFTTKVNWNETNTIPYDLFWWEGLDGSKALTHTFKNPMEGYNGFVRPDCFLPTWKNFRQKTAHTQSLLAVGYGDGGGGVSPEMVQRETQLRDFPALPKARWGRVDEFFAKVRAEARPLPTWQGEIYLELHRATLTTQSHVKRAHRQAERALITAETVGGLAALLGADLPQSLEGAWHAVLKNEFHDVLPGSSIREVNVEAREELEAARDTGLAEQQAALARLADQLPKGSIENALVVVNPTLDARPLRIVVDGQALATADTVPPLGIAVFNRADLAPAEGLSVTADGLENAHLAATIGPDGTVTSLIHKATGREALAHPGNQLWVYPDRPRNWDAWDIDEDYAQAGEQLIAQSREIVASGPHRAALRLTYRFRNSTVTQTYALTANSRRLDIETHIDWHDRRFLLRTLTPADVRADTATFECAHGVIRRPTHTNTSWQQAQFEVVAHRFADLSEPGFGLALLNNAKYGHSVKGNILGLSLVRGPIYPDPLADEGEQSFTYALMPHEGDWAEGGVREEAEDINQPLLSVARSGLAPQTLMPLTLSGIPAALSGLKPAEDGRGLVLRLYEPQGSRGRLSVDLPEGWSLSEPLNLLEEPIDRLAAHDLLPFEVRTWRLAKG